MDKLPFIFERLPLTQAAWCSRNIDDHYQKICELGQGTYGCVYKAKALSESGEIVAIKEMQHFTSKHEEGFPITTLREIKLLQNLNHRNILKIKEVLHRKVKGEFPVVNICLDYMDYDLDDLIQEKNYELTLPRIRWIMQEVLRGVKYLHENYVVHRDIKSKNILLSKQGEVKVADFGLAKLIKNKKFLTVKVVTLWYRAPELLLGNRNYDGKIDVWSAGCLLAELVLRRPLFEDQFSEKQVIKRIFELMGTPDANGWEDEVKDLEIYKEFKPAASTESTLVFDMKKRCPEMQEQGQLLDLLSKMLSLNPHRRLSAAEALEHEFFQEHQPICPSTLIPQPVQALIDTRKSQVKGSHADKKVKLA